MKMGTAACTSYHLLVLCTLSRKKSITCGGSILELESSIISSHFSFISNIEILAYLVAFWFSKQALESTICLQV